MCAWQRPKWLYSLHIATRTHSWGCMGTQYASTHIHSWDVLQLYMSPQAGQSASGDLVAVKDALIAALQTELRGKDRILQAKTKVGAGLS